MTDQQAPRRGHPFFLFLVLVLLLSPTSYLTASQCPDDKRPITKKLRTLPVNYSVFSGRAVRVTKLDRFFIEVQFQVCKSWRGRIRTPDVTVRSNVWDLGPVFEAEQDYLVFAYPGPSSSWLQAAPCSDTRKLKDARPWLRALGSPTYINPTGVARLKAQSK